MKLDIAGSATFASASMISAVAYDLAVDAQIQRAARLGRAFAVPAGYVQEVCPTYRAQLAMSGPEARDSRATVRAA